MHARKYFSKIIVTNVILLALAPTSVTAFSFDMFDQSAYTAPSTSYQPSSESQRIHTILNSIPESFHNGTFQSPIPNHINWYDYAQTLPQATSWTPSQTVPVSQAPYHPDHGTHDDHDLHDNHDHADDTHHEDENDHDDGHGHDKHEAEGSKTSSASKKILTDNHVHGSTTSRKSANKNTSAKTHQEDDHDDGDDGHGHDKPPADPVTEELSAIKLGTSILTIQNDAIKKNLEDTQTNVNALFFITIGIAIFQALALIITITYLKQTR